MKEICQNCGLQANTNEIGFCEVCEKDFDESYTEWLDEQFIDEQEQFDDEDIYCSSCNEWVRVVDQYGKEHGDEGSYCSNCGVALHNDYIQERI